MVDPVSHPIEAALSILVPEVESLVAPFRLQHDPSAAAGVPAHITINYPFLPGVDPEPELDQELMALFGETPSFPFTLHRIDRFPEVLFLAPEPERPFKELIAQVAADFPDSPPYGGVFADIVPHLTVAQSNDEQLLNAIEQEFSQLAEEFLPITTRAEQVWLLDNWPGRWRQVRSYALG